MLTPILAHADSPLPAGIVLDDHDDLLLIIRHADRGCLALPLLTENLLNMTDPITALDADEPEPDDRADWQVLRPGSFMFGVTAATLITRIPDGNDLARQVCYADLTARYKIAFPDSDLSDDKLVEDDVLFLATAATLGGTLRPGDGWDGLKIRYGKLHDREPERTTQQAIREYVRRYVEAGEDAGFTKAQIMAHFNEEVNRIGRLMAGYRSPSDTPPSTGLQK